MEDEHLDTIPATESDEVIKSSVEILVPIPSESDGIPDKMCDVSFRDNSPPLDISKDQFEGFFDSNDDSTSIDDDSFSIDDIDYVDASPPDSELVSLEEVKDFHAEDGEIEDDILCENLSKINLLITKIEAINSNPPPSFGSNSSGSTTTRSDYSLRELITIPPRIINREHEEYISLLERLLYDNSSPRPPKDFHANPNTIIESLPTFPIPVEDSGSLREEINIFPGLDESIPPGIESDDYKSEGDDNSTSLPEFESFHVDYPDLGYSTIDVVEEIPIDVPNILSTHPTLNMDFDFIPSHNDLGSDLNVSYQDRNKIYDPGICIEVESTRFLATHSPVIDTLLPFSSENKDKVFNHGVLASKEKSPPSLSHRGFKASKLFHHKSPMLIYGEDIPILDVPFLHFYPP
ncbi:hypothetical protein Tco_0078383 [Tanacetum coccineum]